LHNPEFTLLEWYRVNFDHWQLMAEVERLVRRLLDAGPSLVETERLSYQQAFERHAGIDPHTATHEDFARIARDHEIRPPAELNGHHDAAIWRDLLLTHVVEPKLGKGRLTFVYDYPATQASYARVRPGTPPLAERFELYVNGVEIGNGFHELGDSAEQRTRFERQLHARTVSGLPSGPIDERLLAALDAGLPDCSGVAIGVDRLVMLVAGVTSLDHVLAFPVDRA
jgi:lysyl-tRNA synthetase class 2